MGTFSASLAICAGNSPVTGEFPAHRPVTLSFEFFFDLRLNKPLSKKCEAGDLRRNRTHNDAIVMYCAAVSRESVWIYTSFFTRNITTDVFQSRVPYWLEQHMLNAVIKGCIMLLVPLRHIFWWMINSNAKLWHVWNIFLSKKKDHIILYTNRDVSTVVLWHVIS